MQEVIPFNEETVDVLVRRVSTLRTSKDCVVVGIAGGSASGKGYITERVAPLIPDIVVLTLDDYYLSHNQLPHRGILMSL